jgi:MFS family permease
MIISKIYNKLSESKREDFAVGLVGGLVGGLVWGLVGGLVVGFVWGLVVGFVWGLVVGFVWGLVVGFVWGLVGGLVIILINFKEALPFISGFYEIGSIILGIIVIVEILYWMMDKEKVKKSKLFWHTCKRKLECIFEVLLGLSAITQVYIFTREIAKHYNKEVLEIILKGIGYIGFGLMIVGLIIGLLYIWIKLNSLKYK